MKKLSGSKQRVLERTITRRKYNHLCDGKALVSEKAKEEMRRKPYGMGEKDDSERSNNIP